MFRFTCQAELNNMYRQHQCDCTYHVMLVSVLWEITANELGICQQNLLDRLQPSHLIIIIAAALLLLFHNYYSVMKILLQCCV